MARSIAARRARAVSLSILMLFVTAGAKPKLEERAGAEQPNLLHNPTGKFVWLTQRRLMKRVTHCVPPALPTGGTLRLKSTVRVEINIGKEGKVEGARVIQGHPLLHQAVIEAVRNWRFKPMIVRGKAHGVVGRLSFVLSTFDAPTKKPGCLRGF
jgi:TonB family protein